MIVLLDNYDSFTWNLFDYLKQLGKEVEVVTNDSLTADELAGKKPEALVLSPGPCTPQTAGIMPELIARYGHAIPMLGVCLGYQAMGLDAGASLERALTPMHGKTSLIYHQNDPLFEGIENPFQAMRYHSLQLSNIPNTIRIIAQTAQGEPMALKHLAKPLYGVQFHPESILTPSGKTLLHNWLKLLTA